MGGHWEAGDIQRQGRSIRQPPTLQPTMENEMSEDDKLIFKWVKRIGGTVAFLILLSIFSPIAIVAAGHRGVITTFGKVDERILDEGMHLVNPLSDVHHTNIQIQKHAVKASASSKDLQQITSELTLNFHLDAKKVANIYQQIGDMETVGDRLISPIVQEGVKAATARYNAEELITKRPEVRDEIKNAITVRLTHYGIDVDDFSITNFDFSHTFNEAIEAKVTAEQQKLKADRDLDRIKIEAEQKIASARAEAESLRMQKQEITPDLIKLREIEVQARAVAKWNGALPIYMLGNSTPMINLNR